MQQVCTVSVFVMCVSQNQTDSILLVADVLFLGGVKEQVADGSYKPVNSKGDHGQEDVRQRSRFEALGLERRVVNDQASDPTQEKGQKKTYEVVVVLHDLVLLFYFLGAF